MPPAGIGATIMPVGHWQTPAEHFMPWQSLGLVHVWPGLQREQGPPQSVSVSSSFFTPSLQVAATHCPAVHTRDAQSDGFAHFMPGLQGGQFGPPQPTSVSPGHPPSPASAPPAPPSVPPSLRLHGVSVDTHAGHCSPMHVRYAMYSGEAAIKQAVTHEG